MSKLESGHYDHLWVTIAATRGEPGTRLSQSELVLPNAPSVLVLNRRADSGTISCAKRGSGATAEFGTGARQHDGETRRNYAEFEKVSTGDSIDQRLPVENQWVSEDIQFRATSSPPPSSDLLNPPASPDITRTSRPSNTVGAM
jgi:hypothetical protein